MKISVASGGFDPLHSGHIQYLKASANIGDHLVVALNSDDWLIAKKGKNFLPFTERKLILEHMEMVDEVIEFDDDELGSCKNALYKVKEKYPNDEVIFCNGGDRDKEKRPLMGAVAQDYSDHIVVTNDNPRTENQMQIINDILSGMNGNDNVLIETDRKKAIQSTIAQIKDNKSGGVVLIAGKGHENYQEIDGHFFEFNDKQIVQSSMDQ